MFRKEGRVLIGVSPFYLSLITLYIKVCYLFRSKTGKFTRYRKTEVNLSLRNNSRLISNFKPLTLEECCNFLFRFGKIMISFPQNSFNPSLFEHKIKSMNLILLNHNKFHNNLSNFTSPPRYELI